MVESGKSEPSLGTLTLLCDRMGITLGRFFAKGQERAFYAKSDIISEIRRMFLCERYGEITEIAVGEDVLDEELSVIFSLSHLRYAKENVRLCRIGEVARHLTLSRKYASGRAIQRYADNTARFIEKLISQAKEKRIPANLCNMSDFMPCDIDTEFFVYLCALRSVESEEYGHARAFLTSGLMISEQYRLHIKACLLCSTGEHTSALPLFTQAAEMEPKSFFSLLRIYRDTERCAKELNDYETAYTYSHRHLELLENSEL